MGVDMLPPWLAPNVITFFGFGWILASLFLLIMLCGGSTDGPISPYLCVFVGVSLIIYNIADNCDGKQARKNGSVSPLGMLFDHGLDAFVSVIINIVVTRVGQVGSGPIAIIGIQLSTLPFFYLTMEEYFLGHQTQPLIGGPDDMCLLMAFACFLCAHKDMQLKLTTEVAPIPGVGPMRCSSIIVGILWFVEAVSIISSFLNYRKARTNSHFQNTFSWRVFTGLGGFMFLNTVIYTLYGCATGSDVLDTHTHLPVLAFAGQYLQVTLRMLLAHATGDAVQPYNW